MKMLSNAGLFALFHVAAYGQTCTPETQPAFANVLDTLYSFTGSCGADVFAGVPTTAAPTPAPTTAAPTTPAPTTPAPTTPAPTTPAPTPPPPTPPPPTPPPPTPPPTQGPTTCAPQLCIAPVSMTTTNTTFSSTTTNTTLPGPATAAPTMTTTNTTTLTTVTTTNTTTASTATATTTNSTVWMTTSTNTTTMGTTSTTETTETTTNYTTTTTNTTLSGNSWTAAPTMTTTNTTTLTTVTTTNTTLVTAAPTQTTTNVTTTAKITTVTTRDPCACYTTTASGARRLQPTKIPRRLQATSCNTSCAAITSMGFASNHPCASSIAANTTAECNNGANALFSTCMPSFTLKCPADNDAATTKPFVHSAGKPLKCKVCGAVVAGADSASAELGKYRTSLTFGNNVAINGFAEGMISGYAIHIVDVDGKVVKDTGVKVKSAGSLSCCKPDQYIAFLEGDWPATGAMFSVVPYLTMSSTSTIMLPMGTGMSAAFTDVGNVPTKEVVQDLSLKGMTPAGCNELKDDPNSDDILVTGVATAAAKNAAGITKDMFTVVNNSKACSETATAARRLEAVQRRLSTHQLDFQIKAVVPATITYDATTVDGADLVTEVKKAAKAKSNIEPVIASADVAAPVVGPVVGEPESPVTGAAHPVAGSFLSSIIVLIAALAGPGLLA